MKTKRMVLCLLSCLILMIGFCFPASASGQELSGKIVVWVGDLVEKAYRDIANAFSAETGVEVEIVPYTGLTAADKLALDGPSGVGGDVYVQGGGGSLGDAITQGLFMEIPAEKVNAERFSHAALSNYIYNGALYGIPTGVETQAFMYNKDLLPEIPEDWTFEDLLEHVNPLYDKENDRYGLLMDIGNYYFMHAFVDAYGGYIFQEKDGVYDVQDIGLNNDGAKEALGYIYSLYGTAVPANMDYGAMCSKFLEGKCAVIYDGPWNLPTYADINLGIAPLPKMKNGQFPRTFSGAYGLAVSAYTQNKEASIAFLEFCGRPDNIMMYARVSGRIPATTECLELPEIANDPLMGGFAKQIERSFPQPNIPEMNMVWEPIQNFGAAVLTQGAPLEATLDLAVEQIREAISLMGI